VHRRDENSDGRWKGAGEAGRDTAPLASSFPSCDATRALPVRRRPAAATDKTPPVAGLGA
jgi:hypothetical protein